MMHQCTSINRRLKPTIWWLLIVISCLTVRSFLLIRNYPLENVNIKCTRSIYLDRTANSKLGLWWSSCTWQFLIIMHRWISISSLDKGGIMCKLHNFIQINQLINNLINSINFFLFTWAHPPFYILLKFSW